MDEISVETSDLELEPGKDLFLFDGAGTERLRLDAGSGLIVIRNRDSKVVIRIDAEDRNLILGGFGRDGDLLLFPKEAISHNPRDSSIHLNGETPSARIGNNLHGGRLSVGGPVHQIEAQGKTG